MPRRRLLLGAGVVACLGVAAWLLVRLWQGVTTSVQAEMTHQAYMLTLDLAELYVRENPGKWVRSWADLEHLTVPAERQNPNYRWPEDAARVRERVRINFGLTRAQVAAMDAATFSAVQPVFPNYGPDEPGIEALLRAARQ